jgi:PTH1 family peptidyl-tRNA hydrolase
MKYLIVGLGNIGSEYELTRHNVGFLVADYLAENAKVNFEISKLASTANFKFKGKNIHLIKPSTYMNLSGKAVNYWMQHLKIPIEKTLIVTDDIALPYEKIRIRSKGSSAGHNGLKNIEGKTYLSIGKQKLELFYYENDGTESLDFEIEGPGIKRQQIPMEIIFFNK